MSMLDFYNTTLQPFILTGLFPATIGFGLCGALMGGGTKGSSGKARLRSAGDMILLSWGIVLVILALYFVVATFQGTQEIDTVRTYVDEIEKARI